MRVAFPGGLHRSKLCDRWQECAWRINEGINTRKCPAGTKLARALQCFAKAQRAHVPTKAPAAAAPAAGARKVAAGAARAEGRERGGELSGRGGWHTKTKINIIYTGEYNIDGSSELSGGRGAHPSS